MKVLRLRWISLALSTAIILILLLPHGTSDAATNFSFNAQAVYRVIDDSTTQVTESYAVTNQSEREFLTQVKLITPVDTIQKLEAHYPDGGTIGTTTLAQTNTRSGIDYPYQQLTLSFPRQNYGQGKTWNFVVSYTATGLVESHGGAHTVYVPAFKRDTSTGSFGYSARVDVPSSFGTAHLTGTKLTDSGTTGDRQWYSFGTNVLADQSLALSFGTRTVYRTNFNFPLTNSSGLDRTLTVALPPNLNNQRVVVGSLDPQPNRTHLDADGNVLADYRVPAHGHLVVKTKIDGDVSYREYNQAASGKRSDIPAELVQRYTAPTKYWQTDGAVGDRAGQLAKADAPVITNVKSIYDFVVDHLSYNDDKIKFNVRQGAAKALANPTNVVCLEYSDLLVAMLRSQGIPARMPVGYGYSGNLKVSSSVTDSLHSWVEAYVPGIGWMTLDPTWGEKFDNFGLSDLDHFAFAVWGGDDQLPAAVMQGKTDLGYEYEDTTLDYTAAASVQPASTTLKVERFQILPFLSLDRVSVTANQTEATTDNLVKYGPTNLNIGGLAPQQRYSHLKLHWGGGQLAQATLTGTLGGSSLVLAHSTLALVRWPMVVTVVVLLGLALAIVIRLRPHKAGPNHV